MRLIIKDLIPGKQYHLQFRSKAGAEVSEWGMIHRITIGDPTVKPRVPENVSLESIGDSFSARWNRVTHSEDGSPATDLAGYVVRFRNTVSDQTAIFETTDTSFELTFNLNTALFAPLAGSLGAQVAARNITGVQGDWSPEIIAVNPPPNPVRNLEAQGVLEGITANWDVPLNLEDDFLEYRAYTFDNANFEINEANRFWSGVSLNAMYHTQDDNRDHYIKVVAVDKFGSASTVSTAGPVRPRVSTKVDIDPPDVPTNLAGTIDGNVLTVTWTPPANPDNDLSGYRIGYRPAGGSGWATVLASHEDSSVIIQPIERFKDYEVRIQAHDFSFNYSNWSTIVTVEGEANVPPAVPTGLEVKGAITSAMVFWDANTEPNLTGYEVQFKADTAPVDDDPVFFTTGRNMSFTENVTRDTNYYARVRAVGTENLKSAWSAPALGQVGFPPPPETSDGNPPASSPKPIVTGGLDALYVSYPAVDNADPVTYEVHVSTNSDFTPADGTKASELNGTATTIRTLPSGTALVTDTTYYVKIVARDIDGAAAPSAQASAALRKLSYPEVEQALTDGNPPANSPVATVAGGVRSLFAVWPAISNNDPVTYEIHLGTTAGFTPAAGTKVGETNSTFTSIERLPNGNVLAYDTDYFVKIIAKDADGAAAAGAASAATKVVRIPTEDLNFDPVKAGIPSVFRAPTARPATANNGSIYYGADGSMQMFQGGQWVDIPVATQDDIAGVNDRVDNTITGSVIQYAVGSSETVAPGSGWSVETPTRTPGTYIWFRSVITYADGSGSTSNPALLTGPPGSQGTPAPVISLASESQVLISPPAGGATTPTTTKVTGTAANATISTWEYSINGGNFSTTAPAGVSRSGNVVTVTGSTMAARTIGIRASGNGVSDTVTIAKVSDGAQGGTGGTGEDAITLVLTNESHTFPGSTTAALAGSASTSIIAYKGATRQSIAVGSITGQVTGLTTAVAGSGTNAPTITITVTTALTALNGVLTIPVTVDGKSFTKNVSWSVSRQGSQGIPGVKGDDGAQLYTWLKYADTPTTGMSDSPAGKTYMGIAYNKTSSTESTNYADYSWSLIQGAEGKGVSSTVVTYQTHSNGTAAPTGNWSASPTATSPGQFLWTRTVTTYTDGTTSTAYSVAAHGNTGPGGSTGAPGRGITGTTVHYQKHTNGTTAPTGTWTTTIPATSPGEYLWTRTTTTYSAAPLSVVSYSVAAHGLTGQQGIPGEKGADGQTTYTWVKYAPNGNPTAAQMSDQPANMTHIGLAFNKTTAVESNVPGDYSWSLIQGAEGAAGVSITSITPFFRTVAKGAAAPAQPAGTGSPTGWSTTEPTFVINTELYRTERILYSNNTASWTPITKVAAYEGIDQVNTIAITADRRVRKDNRAPVVADGAGAPVGALWYQYGPATAPGTGTVLRQTFEWTGSAWQPRGIDRTFIPAVDIGTGTFGDLTGGRLVANSVTANEIAANTLTANEIAANAITADELAANSVQAGHIVANAVDASKINVNTLIGDEAWMNTLVTAQSFTDNAVINSANITGTLTIGQVAGLDNVIANKGRIWRQPEAPPAGTVYRWTGEPHASTSEKVVDGEVVATNLAVRTQGRSPSFRNNNGLNNITEHSVTLPKPVPGHPEITTAAMTYPTGTTPYQIASWYDPDGLMSSPGQSRGFGVWVYTNEPGIRARVHHMQDSAGTVQQYELEVSTWTWIQPIGVGAGHIIVMASKPDASEVSSEGRFWATGVISLAEEEPFGFFDGDSPDDRAGDLWIHTGEGNKPYTWGSVIKDWVLAADEDIDAIQGTIDDWTYPGTTEINGGSIRTRSITAEQLEANIIKVGSTLIAPGAISTEFIAANAIKATHIDTDAIEARHIKAGSITIGVGAPIAPGVVATPGDVDNAVGPINTRITDWTTPGFTTIEGGKITTDSISARSIKTEEIATDTAFINNLKVTTANITDLTFDKIEGGSGIITDLNIKSTLTMGDAFTMGAIQSFNFIAGSGGGIGPGVSPAGYRLDNAGIIIHSGSISAAALNIQYGQNLLRAEYADFEFPASFYNNDNLNTTNFDATIVPGGRFGSQHLRLIALSPAAGEVFMGTSSTDYNIPIEGGKQYIISAYVSGASRSSSEFQFRLKWNDGSWPALMGNVLIQPSQDWTRVSAVVTAPNNVTAAVMTVRCPTAGAGTGFAIDGLQVEEKIGASDNPSSWHPASTTTIDGGMIRTGEIRSNSTVNINGSVQPMWSINMSGNMQINSALIRGAITLGTTADSAASYIRSANYLAGNRGFEIRGSDGRAEFRNLVANSISTDALAAGNINVKWNLTAGGEIIAGPEQSEHTRMSPTGVEYYDGSIGEAGNLQSRLVSKFGRDLQFISNEGIYGIDENGEAAVAALSTGGDPLIDGTALLGTLALQNDQVDLNTELGHFDKVSFAGNTAEWTFDTNQYPWHDYSEKTVGEVLRDQQAGRAIAVFLTARVRMNNSSVTNAYSFSIRKTERNLTDANPNPPQPNVGSGAPVLWKSGAIHMAQTMDVFTGFMGMHVPSRSERARWLVTITKEAGAGSFRVEDMKLLFIDMGPIPDVGLDSLSRVVADASPPPPPVTPRKTYTSRWYANSIRRAQGSNVTSTGDRAGQALQGWTFGMRGDPFHTILGFTGNAHFGETGRTITAALSGATVNRVRIRVSHMGGYQNQAPRLGIQSSSTAIPSINQTLGTMKLGETKYFILDNTFRTRLGPGSNWRYITFGPHTRSNGAYAAFHGTSGGNNRRVELEITYTK